MLDLGTPSTPDDWFPLPTLMKLVLLAMRRIAVTVSTSLPAASLMLFFLLPKERRKKILSVSVY